MIIQLNTAYLNAIKTAEISELYYGIVKNGHYLDCDDATREKLTDAMERCGSRMQKQLVKSNHQGHLTAELRKYLTTISSGQYTYSELMTIICKPSCLMIENLAYESDVYRSIIGTYANDPTYRNLFRKLEDAKNLGWLTFLHAGGFGMMAPLLNYYDERDYKNVADKKIAVLMDRDTDLATQFPDNRHNLMAMLAGKKYSQLSNGDIYTLAQNEYVWHMWYKRAIENYFPKTQFDNLRYDTSTVPATPADWSYKNLGGKGGIRGYKKQNLSDLKEGMSRSDYESNCAQFVVGGVSMSEMQLFLLKLVKLI